MLSRLTGGAILRKARRLYTHPFVIIVLSITFSLIIGEALVRFLGYAPNSNLPSPHPWAMEDSDLGWVNNQGVHLSNEIGNAPMTYWDKGRRASQGEHTDGNDKKNIAIVGGSFTQGHGIVDKETFAWTLNENNDGLFIENYGTGGYGTFQSLLMAENILKQGKVPDLVVYGFCYFHGERNVQAFKFANALRREGEYFAAPFVYLDQNDKLQRGRRIKIKAWFLQSQSALVQFIHDQYYKFIFRHREENVHKVTNDLLKEMSTSVQNKGAKFLVVILDNIAQRGPYKEFMNDNGITHIDCTYPEGSWWENEDLRVGKTGHPNGKLNEYWAGCIQAWLDDNF